MDALTSMMAANRYRLMNRAADGDCVAGPALALLGRKETMLGAILLGNNLDNAATASRPT